MNRIQLFGELFDFLLAQPAQWAFSPVFFTALVMGRSFRSQCELDVAFGGVDADADVLFGGLDDVTRAQVAQPS